MLGVTGAACDLQGTAVSKQLTHRWSLSRTGVTTDAFTPKGAVIMVASVGLYAIVQVQAVQLSAPPEPVRRRCQGAHHWPARLKKGAAHAACKVPAFLGQKEGIASLIGAIVCLVMLVAYCIFQVPRHRSQLFHILVTPVMCMQCAAVPVKRCLLLCIACREISVPPRGTATAHLTGQGIVILIWPACLLRWCTRSCSGARWTARATGSGAAPPCARCSRTCRPLAACWMTQACVSGSAPLHACRPAATQHTRLRMRIGHPFQHGCSLQPVSAGKGCLPNALCREFEP